MSNPIDMSKWQSNACGLLSSATLTAAALPGTPAGKESVNRYGDPTCLWSAPNDEGSAGTTIGSASLHKAGISYFYGARSGAAVFDTFTVQGYPAVIDLADDTRSEGDCTVEIGVSDTIAVQTTVTLGALSPQYSTSCDSAKALADGVITTLKSGG